MRRWLRNFQLERRVFALNQAAERLTGEGGAGALGDAPFLLRLVEAGSRAPRRAGQVHDMVVAENLGCLNLRHLLSRQL